MGLMPLNLQKAWKLHHGQALCQRQAPDIVQKHFFATPSAVVLAVPDLQMQKRLLQNWFASEAGQLPLSHLRLTAWMVLVLNGPHEQASGCPADVTFPESLHTALPAAHLQGLRVLPSPEWSGLWSHAACGPNGCAMPSAGRLLFWLRMAAAMGGFA